MEAQNVLEGFVYQSLEVSIALGQRTQFEAHQLFFNWFGKLPPRHSPEHQRVLEELQWDALEMERQAGLLSREQEEYLFNYWFHHPYERPHGNTA